jgi:acetyl-CoA acyltransferase
MSANEVAVVGIGMIRFGKYSDVSLKVLGAQAIASALQDAQLERGDIDAAFVANAMASVVTGQVSIVGQTILRADGFEGIPVFNIDNACAGSSSALHLAIQYIRAGAANNVLVLGVEKLVSPDRSKAYVALNGAADIEFVARSGIDPAAESVFISAVYPERLDRYQAEHSLDAQTLAQIAVKNRSHAALNPFAQFVTPITIDGVLSSRRIVGPITALMCAPIGDGASAVVISRKDRVHAGQRPVWIRGSAISMGSPPSAVSSIARTASRAYQEAGLTAADVQVAEVHDSTAFNELLAYEELGLCGPGRGSAFVLDGVSAMGGKVPVNPSGGLESRGHPVAATGTAQICELVMQLRSEAGARQVPGARVALAENAGGFTEDDTAAIAVTILEA